VNEPGAAEKRNNEENLTTADLAGTDPDGPADNARRASAEIQREGENENRNATVPPATPKHVSIGSTMGTTAGAAAAVAKEPEAGPLFSAEEAGDLRAKWDAIQVGFVDEPRRAVQEADGLVAVAMKRLAEQFAAERSTLESQWDRGGDVSTEDLRIALRRYRSFFGRLLSV